jgi:hypothetical protein
VRSLSSQWWHDDIAGIRVGAPTAMPGGMGVDRGWVGGESTGE